VRQSVSTLCATALKLRVELEREAWRKMRQLVVGATGVGAGERACGALSLVPTRLVLSRENLAINGPNQAYLSPFRNRHWQSPGRYHKKPLISPAVNVCTN
jgi:hypothetical protein